MVIPDEVDQLEEPSVIYDLHSLPQFAIGFYDFWLFDRIDANDGWFGSRVKSNATPEIVEELRTWRGNSITLAGKSLKAIRESASRDPNPYRERLRREVESGEFVFDRH